MNAAHSHHNTTQTDPCWQVVRHAPPKRLKALKSGSVRRESVQAALALRHGAHHPALNTQASMKGVRLRALPSISDVVRNATGEGEGSAGRNR